MVKLRIVNGVQEVDGTCDEIVEVMRKLSAPAQRPSSPGEPEQIVFSEIGDPNALEIVELIESMGHPLSFTMAELQKKQYGRAISSKNEKHDYERYHRECEKARDILQEKYGGRWDTEMENIDGKYVKRYKLLETSRMK